MAESKKFDSGAHFYRCDFQVHTPRDNQWKGASSADPADRTEYAKKFVAQCREIGLNAIAITDHHDFVMFPFIKAAAAEELDEHGRALPQHRRLVVFPGLELTLGTPTFQAILILDAFIDEDRLPEDLQALNLEVHDPAAAKLPSVTSIDHLSSPKALHEALDIRPWLKGKYVVLPNVTDNGHKTMLRSGMKVAYREMPCVGGYLDGTVERKVGEGNRKIFSGENKEYGNKRIALFQTSDSRSETFKDLGKNSTWVKWATPTAEALRQACLAQESRISQSEPQMPNAVISRVEVSNSKFLGPVEIDFNAQYNAIIGGRGTGKSTILGYLRWALCDQPVERSDDQSSESGSLAARQKLLIESTLAPLDARVEVQFEINGIQHVVRRSAGNGEVQLKVADDDFKVVREQDIRAILPVHAYSQKQLSSVAVRVDELSRFITAPIQNRLDEFDRANDEISGKLRENYATLQRVRVLEGAITRSDLEIKSLATQADSLRKSLAGLSAEDQATLASKRGYDHARDDLRTTERRLDEAEEAVSGVLEHLERINAATESLDDWPESLRETGTSLGEASSATLKHITTTLSEALTDLRTLREMDGSIGSKIAAIVDATDTFDAQYASVKTRSTAHEAKLAELAELERRSAAAKKLRDEQRADRTRLGDPLEQHRSYRQDLVKAAKDRSDVVSGQCVMMGELSDGLIRASLERGVGLARVRDRFRAAIAGSGVRNAKVEALFDGLQVEPDPLDSWSSVLSELEILKNLDADAKVQSSLTPTLTRLGFATSDQEKARTRLSTDSWLDLLLTPVLDKPSFEYRVKESDYIDFALASAGQQATALLRVLLAQPGMPLIVDQPEDDLDSQVVLDVVKRLWVSKTHRQIIFTSHNANLVVNGDAELVVVCDNRSDGDQSGGTVSKLGAIDVDDIRDAITRIMEGGEGAFKLRKEKYGF